MIEKVAPTDLVSEVVHCIPHRPVFTPGKAATKVRVVSDASPKYQHGQSLNAMLYKDPSLTKDLREILTRFRLMKNVLMANVEKAFH